MDLENLKNRRPELLQFLKDENYSDTVIRVVSNEIKNILENAEAFGWEIYRDVYHAHEAKGLSKDVMRSKRHCLRMIRGCSYKKNVTAVFKAGRHWKEEPCSRIVTYFPALRENRKTIQYLTEEETDMVRKALCNRENRLSLRDRAVGTLLLYMGLRGCDIAGLLLESVDWDRELLHIVQHKTDVPMELPLTPTIGNAIFDYLNSERPSSGDAHIFLSEVPPYRPLASQSIGNIALRIYQAASIRQNTGDRKGTHIFRHHAASHMLECGIAQPVISRTLGHTAPQPCVCRCCTKDGKKQEV